MKMATIRYPGAPHGLTATHQDRVNADLLAFLRSWPSAGATGEGSPAELTGLRYVRALRLG